MIEVDPLADVHTHLREGEVVGPLITEAIAGGADVLGPMPNTNAGLTTADSVLAYIDKAREIVDEAKQEMSFLPFLMMTEETTEKDIDECISYGISNAKVYPRLRTTKSENGVVRYGKLFPLIKHCGIVGMKVHFHPEHPSMTYGNRVAEFAFLPIVRMFLEETNATIVWEHGTDARCIPHWEQMAKIRIGKFGLTLTAHHLAANEDSTFGDVRAVCKPPIKTEADRLGLINLVEKDYNWVMAGGDSAFHNEGAKHPLHGCCACGAYTGPFLLPLYAHALENLLATPQGIKTFVRFTSRNARHFHNLPKASRKLKLYDLPWVVPHDYEIGSEIAFPFWAQQTLNWRIG